MYFDNPKHYSLVQISDEEYEVYDNVKYFVGEIVCLDRDVFAWDIRLWHPNAKLEHFVDEHYVVCGKEQSDTVIRGNIHIKSYRYDVVKVDDPRIHYNSLMVEELRKLTDK